MARVEDVLYILKNLKTKDLVRCSNTKLRDLQDILDCKRAEVSKELYQRTHIKTHHYSPHSESSK